MNDGTASQGAGVTLANWRLPPWNCYAFHHIAEVLPVSRVGHDPARVSAWSQAPRAIGEVAFAASDGTAWTVDRMLTHTATDGFLVLHRGRLAFEW